MDRVFYSALVSRTYKMTGLLAFAFGLAILLQTLFHSDAWQHRQRARFDLEALRLQNAAAEQQVAKLRREIEALRTRPLVQENVVRQELGYVRSGEIVLELGAAERP